MKAGDKIITKDGIKLIAITANGSSPCAGCVFNEGVEKPCMLPGRTEEALCWDDSKSEFKDLVFIVDEEKNKR